MLVCDTSHVNFITNFPFPFSVSVSVIRFRFPFRFQLFQQQVATLSYHLEGEVLAAGQRNRIRQDIGALALVKYKGERPRSSGDVVR